MNQSHKSFTAYSLLKKCSFLPMLEFSVLWKARAQCPAWGVLIRPLVLLGSWGSQAPVWSSYSSFPWHQWVLWHISKTFIFTGEAGCEFLGKAKTGIGQGLKFSFLHSIVERSLKLYTYKYDFMAHFLLMLPWSHVIHIILFILQKSCTRLMLLPLFSVGTKGGFCYLPKLG
jgi:hypothetical protein